jgi:hypothetical protein
MEIIRHLSDEALTDMLLECDEREMRKTLQRLPALAQAAAERDDMFWGRQRSAVWERIHATAERRNRLATLAWALAAACLLLFGLSLDRRSATSLQRARIDPDSELLRKVESEVQSTGPRALRPAAFLAEQISQSKSWGSEEIQSREKNTNAD